MSAQEQKDGGPGLPPADAPRGAHSKSEYKRLNAQGANVVPPAWAVTSAAPRLSEAEVRALLTMDVMIECIHGDMNNVDWEDHIRNTVVAALFPPTEGQQP